MLGTMFVVITKQALNIYVGHEWCILAQVWYYVLLDLSGCEMYKHIWKQMLICNQWCNVNKLLV